MFNRRYWDVLAAMSLGVQRGVSDADDSDRRQAHNYFRLSDEQVFQALQERRVSRRVWETWAQGIQATMAREPFQSEWSLHVTDVVKSQHYGALASFLNVGPHYPSYWSWRYARR
jgi:hypothetical protein